MILSAFTSSKIYEKGSPIDLKKITFFQRGKVQSTCYNQKMPGTLVNSRKNCGHNPNGKQLKTMVYSCRFYGIWGPTVQYDFVRSFTLLLHTLVCHTNFDICEKNFSLKVVFSL